LAFVLTASIPIKNSAQHLSKSTIEILVEELSRANKFWNEYLQQPSALDELLKKSDVLTKHQTYLTVVVSAVSEEEFHSLYILIKS
jgi:poly(A) polymerase Pap1